jgi:hypothetical protein
MRNHYGPIHISVYNTFYLEIFIFKFQIPANLEPVAEGLSITDQQRATNDLVISTKFKKIMIDLRGQIQST